MKKILTVGHRKMDGRFFDVTTPEQRDAAFLCVFHLFNDEWEFYHDLDLDVVTDDELQETRTRNTRTRDASDKLKMRAWYRAALAGDANAAHDLLTFRKQQGYEYEDEWRIEDVEDALSVKAKLKRKSRSVRARSLRK